MNFQGMVIGASLTGVAAAILWVALWDVVLPQSLPGLAWSGYDALTVPVFFFGLIAAAVAMLLSKIRR